MRYVILAAALLCAGAAPAATAPDIAAFVKRDGFTHIKISPDGDYYAASVPGEDNSVLVIVHRADNKPTGGFGLGKNTYIADFEWVNPTRARRPAYSVMDTARLSRDFGIRPVSWQDGLGSVLDESGIA